MTRLANRHGAINLAQGMPDFETPQDIKDAACRAIQDGFNQYAITWGAPPLRQAIADKAARFYSAILPFGWRRRFKLPPRRDKAAQAGDDCQDGPKPRRPGSEAL